MGQMSKDLDKICDMKATLLKKIEADIENIDRMPMESVQGVATVVDMIHHLAEAEKCCWEACYYKTVVKAMREGYAEPDWEDDEDMEHADTTRRSYPRTTRRSDDNRGNRRGEWRQNRNSDGEYMEGGVMQHTDMMDARSMHGMRDMTPDEQLNHVKADVNMMWENASTDQRKRIKENLLKLVNSMSV